MVEEADIIKNKVLRFYNSIKDLFPIKKVFLYDHMPGVMPGLIVILMWQLL